MPFKSEKQRKFMWSKKPEIAKRWAKKYQKGGKADTVPAMLTPGEVVLNEKQMTALEKYVGQSREEIFGKIKVPGFNIGGKVRHKYYQEGGKVDKSRGKTTRELALSV